MFSTNSRRCEAPGERIVVVVADRRGLTDWAGAAIENLIARRAEVRVLYCGADRTPEIAESVRVDRLDAIRFPGHVLVESVEPQAPADAAERVRAALEVLAADRSFNAIHFGVRGGLGFRCIQAKRAGTAFGNVNLVANLDSCSQLLREQNRSWPSGVNDLIIDYMEKYSFENADCHDTNNDDIISYINTMQWRVNPDSTVDNNRSLSPNPLVTIGIAHYNLGQYLPAALASLECQTYPNREVIVIDDGSTEALSIAAFSDLEKRHPGFRFLRQANAGIGATRNRCLAEARGQFFIPMDAETSPGQRWWNGS